MITINDLLAFDLKELINYTNEINDLFLDSFVNIEKYLNDSDKVYNHNNIFYKNVSDINKYKFDILINGDNYVLNSETMNILNKLILLFIDKEKELYLNTSFDNYNTIKSILNKKYDTDYLNKTYKTKVLRKLDISYHKDLKYIKDYKELSKSDDYIQYLTDFYSKMKQKEFTINGEKYEIWLGIVKEDVNILSFLKDREIIGYIDEIDTDLYKEYLEKYNRNKWLLLKIL